jgi:predicted lipoprotein with Yx(FWY)xxD motif
MATDTTMTTEDTSMGTSSEPMTGAGPSDCPAIAEDNETEPAGTTEAESGTEAPAGSDGGATTEASAASEASVTTQAAADTSGQSVAPGESIPAASGPFVQILETDEFGPILVDSECRTLYVFKEDSEGEPTCFDECAVEWPPLFVPDDSVPPLADELDPSPFSVVDHADGPMLKVGDWPLYYFEDDTEPGEITGQGHGRPVVRRLPGRHDRRERGTSRADGSRRGRHRSGILGAI